MPDNVVLNPGSGGPTVRAIARQGGSIDTQVMAIDIGGAGGNPELLVAGGSQTKLNSIPIAVSFEQEGTQVTGVPQMTGGTGWLGWWSGIFSKLSTIATALGSGQNTASPTSQLLVSGQFNTTPATIVSGNSSPLQTDNAGRLIVNVGAGSSGGAAGYNQGSTTAGEQGPLIQGAVVSTDTSYTAAQTQPATIDTGGAMRVNVVRGGGTGGTSSTYGSAFPSVGTAIGVSDGTNMRAIKRRVPYAFTGMSGGNALLTGAQQVSSAAGALNTISSVYNPNNQPIWLQIYDVATAPTLGTTVPKLSFFVPSFGIYNDNFGEAGVQIANGIYVAATTTQNGSTLPATGLSGNILYQ